MDVRPEEFISSRTMSREFGQVMDRLVAGSLEKVVVVNRNTPTAVIVTVERYEQLVRKG